MGGQTKLTRSAQAAATSHAGVRQRVRRKAGNTRDEDRLTDTVDGMQGGRRRLAAMEGAASASASAVTMSVGVLISPRLDSGLALRWAGLGCGLGCSFSARGSGTRSGEGARPDPSNLSGGVAWRLLARAGVLASAASETPHRAQWNRGHQICAGPGPRLGPFRLSCKTSSPSVSASSSTLFLSILCSCRLNRCAFPPLSCRACCVCCDS